MRRLVTLGMLALSGCAQRQPSARAVVTPAIPAAMQRQVKNALDAGDGDYELRSLRERLMAEPGNLNVRLELGRAYQRKGSPELALDHYRLAVERYPASAEASLLLAKALKASGEGGQAVKCLERYLATSSPATPEMYSWLGIVRDDAGDWKGGEQAHREALTKANRDYLHNNLGYSLLMQGRKEEAAAEFRAALQLNPHSAIARDNLGTALADNPKEAILNWQALNEPAVAHSNLAAVLIEQGKYAEARQELKTALEFNRTHPAALANLKLVSELDGKPAAIPESRPKTTRWSRARGAFGQLWNGQSAAPKRDAAATVAKFPE